MRRLALRISSGYNEDIWIKELPDGALSRLTFDEGRDVRPRWTPDGRTVTFLSERLGEWAVWSKLADGTGGAELVFEWGNALGLGSASWSPDGEWLVVYASSIDGQRTSRDVLALRPDVDTVPRPLLTEAFDEMAPALSPDGRWLAYVSDETGRYEVFVRPFPDVDAGKWQVSINGGGMPLWAHSGRELFFVDQDGTLVAARVEITPSFRRVRLDSLFTLPPSFRVEAVSNAFDVTRDDQTFIWERRREVGLDPQRLVLVQNFFSELRARLPN